MDQAVLWGGFGRFSNFRPLKFFFRCRKKISTGPPQKKLALKRVPFRMAVHFFGRKIRQSSIFFQRHFFSTGGRKKCFWTLYWVKNEIFFFFCPKIFFFDVCDFRAKRNFQKIGVHFPCCKAFKAHFAL